MSELAPTEATLNTPEKYFEYVFDQVQAVAERYGGKPVLKSTEKLEEYFSMSADSEGCVLIFSTENLNISKLDNPEGAYENTFTFTFESNSLNFTYYEALPRRLEGIKINAQEYANVESLKKKLVPFVKKINILLAYFNLPTQIQIPA